MELSVCTRAERHFCDVTYMRSIIIALLLFRIACLGFSFSSSFDSGVLLWSGYCAALGVVGGQHGIGS